jgi:hypothetical protein
MQEIEKGREESTDAFFQRINRKLQTMHGAFRDCPTPSCRRSRTCRGVGFRCVRDRPSEPWTPERHQEFTSNLKQALRAVLGDRPDGG